MLDQRFLIRLLSNLLENELRYAGEGAKFRSASSSPKDECKSR